MCKARFVPRPSFWNRKEGAGMAERTCFRANSPNLSSNKIRAAEIEAADKCVFPWTAVNVLNVWEISLGLHSPRSLQN